MPLSSSCVLLNCELKYILLNCVCNPRRCLLCFEPYFVGASLGLSPSMAVHKSTDLKSTCCWFDFIQTYFLFVVWNNQFILCTDQPVQSASRSLKSYLVIIFLLVCSFCNHRRHVYLETCTILHYLSNYLLLTENIFICSARRSTHQTYNIWLSSVFLFTHFDTLYFVHLVVHTEMTYLSTQFILLICPDIVVNLLQSFRKRWNRHE